uniref:Uncharacterized protein TCIL3000_11_16860 n=1 Tax=Trypanosoma congolense (strain IL3000) TaxID=1068625 RepID=G0V3E9_TRYCI|nr:unnamed protein product [Trypanosoma congolense IL3000]
MTSWSFCHVPLLTYCFRDHPYELCRWRVCSLLQAILGRGTQAGNSSAMVLYVPFIYQVSAFSVFNALGSLHAWYVTRRRMMLISGTFNSALGAAAGCAYSFDPMLSNVYVSVASLCAFGHFTLHALRTKTLLRLSAVTCFYYAWCVFLLAFGIHRGRWAYALRHD